MGRAVLEAYKIAVEKPLGTSFVSEAIDVNTIDNVGIIIETTGVSQSSGEFKVEARAAGRREKDSSAWVGLDVSPAMLLPNSDTQLLVAIRSMPFSQLRVRFIAGAPSDDGFATVWVEGKGGNV